MLQLNTFQHRPKATSLAVSGTASSKLDTSYIRQCNLLVPGAGLARVLMQLGIMYLQVQVVG